MALPEPPVHSNYGLNFVISRPRFELAAIDPVVLPLDNSRRLLLKVRVNDGSKNDHGRRRQMGCLARDIVERTQLNFLAGSSSI